MTPSLLEGAFENVWPENIQYFIASILQNHTLTILPALGHRIPKAPIGPPATLNIKFSELVVQKNSFPYPVLVSYIWIWFCKAHCCALRFVINFNLPWAIKPANRNQPIDLEFYSLARSGVQLINTCVRTLQWRWLDLPKGFPRLGRKNTGVDRHIASWKKGKIIDEYENRLCGYIRALLSTTVRKYLTRISTDTIPIISLSLPLSPSLSPFLYTHNHLVPFKNPISLLILS